VQGEAAKIGYACTSALEERSVQDPATIETTYAEPLIAWRAWRVRRLERLSQDQPLRLAAIGRLGIPKFWEPRAATPASCSNYRTLHEAPWPSCKCGIYGFRGRDSAEHALVRYSHGGTEGWAFGRVSLWGRIVECERGWRAQYAYPYDLVVFTRDERVAAELRDLYAVDVTTAPPTERPARQGRTRRSSRVATRPASADRDAAMRAAFEQWLSAWNKLGGEWPHTQLSLHDPARLRKLRELGERD
jgi:hypothetical protein